MTRSISLVSELEYLAFAGRIAPLESFLADHGPEPIRASRHAMLMAAMQNNLHIVKWLYAHGAPEKESCAYAAASRGHLPIVEWLYENARDCLDKGHIAQVAADNGHIAVTAWLHDKGIRIPYINTAMNHCAARGDTAMLDWLRAHGADTDNLHKLPLRYINDRARAATLDWCEKIRREKLNTIVTTALNEDAAPPPTLRQRLRTWAPRLP